MKLDAKFLNAAASSNLEENTVESTVLALLSDYAYSGSYSGSMVIDDHLVSELEALGFKVTKVVELPAIGRNIFNVSWKDAK